MVTAAAAPEHSDHVWVVDETHKLVLDVRKGTSSASQQVPTTSAAAQQTQTQAEATAKQANQTRDELNTTSKQISSQLEGAGTTATTTTSGG